MKGYLDAKELESYKKEDLQELAKQLGVDAEGTKKEIAARCAAVEVDIPDNSELTEEDKKVAAEAAAEAAAKAEEEKAAAEAAAKVEEEKAAAEAAAKVEEEKAAAEVAAKAEEEKAAAEAAAKDEEEKKAAGLVKVKAQRRFLDKELNQIRQRAYRRLRRQKAKAERWRQCSRRRSCQSVYLCEYYGLRKAAERGSPTVQNDSKDGVTHGK